MYIETHSDYIKKWDDSLRILVSPLQSLQGDDPISHLKHVASKKKLLSKITNLNTIDYDMCVVIQHIFHITQIQAYEFERKAILRCTSEYGTSEIIITISNDFIQLLKSL